MAQVQAISRDQAVKAFTTRPVPDPQGTSTPESLADAGTALEVMADGGSMVCVIRRKGDRLWIQAATGAAVQNLTELGLELAEETARQAGLVGVQFQTARPGLVRIAQLRGYQVVGWILDKEVK